MSDSHPQKKSYKSYSLYSKQTYKLLSKVREVKRVSEIALSEFKIIFTVPSRTDKEIPSSKGVGTPH